MIVICMALFTPLTQVSAFEYYGTIEYLGVDSDPKFCLVNIEDDPNYTSENIIMFERIVKNSISDWVEKLKEKTGNEWGIDYEFVNFNDPINPVSEKKL